MRRHVGPFAGFVCLVGLWNWSVFGCILIFVVSEKGSLLIRQVWTPLVYLGMSCVPWFPASLLARMIFQVWGTLTRPLGFVHSDFRAHLLRAESLALV